ncbi:MAG: DUF3137 domain-containing protein [Alphaproteobacteria bacterium]|nr:DUF3137 domain-containing protein [Alphaproteobacteria bacterium]
MLQDDDLYFDNIKCANHWRQPVESELTADFQSDWQAQLGGNGDTSGVSRMVLHLRNGFEKYWLTTLQPFLKTKEDLRKKYLSRFWLLFFISLFILPVFAIGIYLLNRRFSQDIDPGLFYMLVAVFVFIIQTPYRSYKKKIKNDVMEKFIAYFGNWRYEHNSPFLVSEIKESKIFPHAREYDTDDCFIGTYRDVKLCVCEQILKSHPDKKGRQNILFQGIAIKIHLNKNFEGETIVLKDLGIFNRFKGFSGLERITLEDPYFEKLFEVYGSDQVESRYLLTPVFMERIVKLKDLYKGKSIQLSFKNDVLLLAIDTKQDMFEPCSFFKTNLNKFKIDTVFEQFLTIFSIVDILRLSQKIGM